MSDPIASCGRDFSSWILLLQGRHQITDEDGLLHWDNLLLGKWDLSGAKTAPAKVVIKEAVGKAAAWSDHAAAAAEPQRPDAAAGFCNPRDGQQPAQRSAAQLPLTAAALARQKGSGQEGETARADTVTCDQPDRGQRQQSVDAQGTIGRRPLHANQREQQSLAHSGSPQAALKRSSKRGTPQGVGSLVKPGPPKRACHPVQHSAQAGPEVIRSAAPAQAATHGGDKQHLGRGSICSNKVKLSAQSAPRRPVQPAMARDASKGNPMQAMAAAPAAGLASSSQLELPRPADKAAEPTRKRKAVVAPNDEAPECATRARAGLPAARSRWGNSIH